MAYLHSQNVIHRDLKLENILIDAKKSTSIKITDFGSAVIWRSQNADTGEYNKMLQDCVGSPYYIAPEVLMSEYD